MKQLLALLLLPLSLLGLALVVVALFFVTLPDVRQMRGCMTTSMYQVKLCPGQADYVTYKNIAPELIDAVVSSEDASFFHHKGFDWHEMKKSLTTNIQNRSYARGGSTITQQLAKNVFLSKNKSIIRKLREAALTILIERYFTKKEILERYLNVVEFGQNIYGVRRAARHYFSKSPSELHVLDSAFLAFLLPNPKGYSKSFENRQLSPFARKTVKTLILRMQSFKKIPAATANAALSYLDQFPWSGLSREQLTAGADSVASEAVAPSGDQILEILESEQQQTNQDSGEAAAPSAEESQGEDENSSTWD